MAYNIFTWFLTLMLRHYQYYSDQKYQDFTKKVKEFSIKLSSAFAKYQIRDNKTNFSCSPLSDFLCLGLGVTSSSGNTQKEILDAFNMDYDTFKKYYNVYFDDLIIRASNSENKSSLSLSNSIWIDKNCKIVDSGLEELKNNEIGVYSGSYMWNNPDLSEEKVKEFFNIITLDSLDKTDWDNLNMGLGNSLFIRKKYSKEFRDKYSNLIKEVPYLLYSTWRYFAEYVLNKHFNNVSDEKILKTIDDEIENFFNGDSGFDIVK